MLKYSKIQTKSCSRTLTNRVEYSIVHVKCIMSSGSQLRVPSPCNDYWPQDGGPASHQGSPTVTTILVLQVTWLETAEGSKYIWFDYSIATDHNMGHPMDGIPSTTIKCRALLAITHLDTGGFPGQFIYPGHWWTEGQGSPAQHSNILHCNQ